MIRFLLLGVVLLSVAYGLKEQGILDRTGLFGTCDVVAQARTVEGQWHACRGGTISGSPDLSRDSCRRGVTRNGVTYWYCPETLVAGRPG